MSDFSKDGFHKVTDAAAHIQITKFMQEESAVNLKNLRATLASEDSAAN